MPHPLRVVLAFLAFALATVGSAQAHPHVYVTMKSELVYAADGTVTGVRHAWTFDDMFSSFATQGLAQKEKGKFTREELAPLAEVNITSLKEYDYFTHARVNGKKVELAPPAAGYYLDFKDGVLTLNFTLPFKAPAKMQNLDIEIYDATYFVDFQFNQKDPVALVNAPAGCELRVGRPFDNTAPAPGKPLNESFFNNLTPSQNYGAQFASKIAVKCP